MYVYVCLYMHMCAKLVSGDVFVCMQTLCVPYSLDVIITGVLAGVLGWTHHHLLINDPRPKGEL